MTSMTRMLHRLILALFLCGVPVVMTTTTSCATAKVQHPNAVDALDSQVYDFLTVFKAALVKAREEFGTSAKARPVLDGATTAYNTLEKAWQLYHAKKPDAPTPADLQAKLKDAQTASANLAGLGKGQP